MPIGTISGKIGLTDGQITPAHTKSRPTAKSPAAHPPVNGQTAAHTTSRPTATTPAAPLPVNRQTDYTFVCGN